MLKALEPHFQLLKKHITKTRANFRYSKLFFRFTVDSATEFLFGESVSSLKDESIGYNQDEFDFAGRKDFPEAFNKSQIYLSTRSLLQNLYWLVNPKDFQIVMLLFISLVIITSIKLLMQHQKWKRTADMCFYMNW